MTRTFLVECYLPGVEQAAVAEAGMRARGAADELRGGGDEIAYVGAMFVAADEVVFHTFTAPDAAIVERASRAAGLVFERIVESIGVLGDLGNPEGVGRELVRTGRHSPVPIGSDSGSITRHAEQSRTDPEQEEPSWTNASLPADS